MKRIKARPLERVFTRLDNLPLKFSYWALINSFSVSHFYPSELLAFPKISTSTTPRNCSSFPLSQNMLFLYFETHLTLLKFYTSSKMSSLKSVPNPHAVNSLFLWILPVVLVCPLEISSHHMNVYRDNPDLPIKLGNPLGRGQCFLYLSFTSTSQIHAVLGLWQLRTEYQLAEQRN